MAGYSSWGHKESDTTEQLTLSLHTFFFDFSLATPKVVQGLTFSPFFVNNLFLLDLPLLPCLSMASFPAGF